MSSPEIRFFKDREGLNIAYAMHGDGPMVICPAWWISHVEKDWDDPRFRGFFERLGRGLTVVRYDRPGVGLSDRTGESRSMADEAGILLDLANELGAGRYGLFAMSCGGPPAIVHAAQHPDRVDNLCLCGSYAEGPTICSVELQDAMLATVRAHWGVGARAMADVFMPDADRDDVRAFAHYQRTAADAAVAERLLELTYAMDARPYLERIFAETLVLHRRRDRAIPLEAGRGLAAGIRGARFVTLEGSAHPPWIGGDDIAGIANAFFLGETQSAETTGPAHAASATGLDREHRCLVVEGAHVPLTPLEYGVMVALVDADGAVVTRDALLENVWGQPFEGSNKVDVLVRGLRRKLGIYAGSVETVTGHGYRFAGWRGPGTAGDSGGRA